MTATIFSRKLFRTTLGAKTPVQVKMLRLDCENYVLCLSDGRREKDRAIRQTLEKKLAADLEKLEKRITSGKLKKETKIGEAIGRIKERYPRVARYYRIEYDSATQSFSMERDEEKVAKAECLDGSYLLKTNRRDLSAEETWRTYSLLTRAEKAFRDMKSPLMERPIFHHLERRVETHIFLCILAYHLFDSHREDLAGQGGTHLVGYNTGSPWHSSNSDHGTADHRWSGTTYQGMLNARTPSQATL